MGMKVEEIKDLIIKSTSALTSSRIFFSIESINNDLAYLSEARVFFIISFYLFL